MTIASAEEIDVGHFLDNQAWTWRQKLYVFVVAMVVVLDGFDNQILGLTIASLGAEWEVTRDAFAPVLALGIVGLSIGTLAGGWLGDKVGRRTMLIVSAAVFGSMTGVTVFANSVNDLLILRFLAGLGLGGAMPNATALLTEFTPARRQVLAITLGIACIPVGGVLGGYLSSFLLPAFGWQSLYIFGAIAPIFVIAALIWIIPESPRYLASKPVMWPTLVGVLNRLSPENKFTDQTKFYVNRAELNAPFSAILNKEYRHDTLALWVAYFTNLLAVYVFFNWMPTMLSLIGLDTSQVGYGSALYNLGSIVGALICVWLVARYGMRLITSGLGVGAVIGGLVFSYLTDQMAIMILLAFMGAFTAGFQILLFSIAARVYPTPIRGTGVGSALALGRLGAIVSSFAGALMLNVDPTGTQFFWFVSGTMGLALVAVLQIRSLRSVQKP